jgi:hypothetical protein
MLLVHKTLFSISQNGISPITLNKKLGNNLNKDIINASISLSSFPFVDASTVLQLHQPKQGCLTELEVSELT